MPNATDQLNREIRPGDTVTIRDRQNGRLTNLLVAETFELNGTIWLTGTCTIQTTPDDTFIIGCPAERDPLPEPTTPTTTQPTLPTTGVTE